MKIFWVSLRSPMIEENIGYIEAKLSKLPPQLKLDQFIDTLTIKDFKNHCGSRYLDLRKAPIKNLFGFMDVA